MDAVNTEYLFDCHHYDFHWLQLLRCDNADFLSVLCDYKPYFLFLVLDCWSDETKNQKMLLWTVGN